MKERSLQWLIFVLILALAVGEKSGSKEDEEESNYDIKTNNIDELDDHTSRVLHMINSAAIKIIEAPDLSKVIKCRLNMYVVCSCLSVLNYFRKNLLINRKNN